MKAATVSSLEMRARCAWCFIGKTFQCRMCLSTIKVGIDFKNAARHEALGLRSRCISATVPNTCLDFEGESKRPVP